MRILTWILRLIIFLFLFGFALRNGEPVTVRYLLDLQWNVPLALVALVFFITGALLGATALLLTVFRQRRENVRLQQENSRLQARVGSDQGAADGI